MAFTYRLNTKAYLMEDKLDSYRSHLKFLRKVSYNLINECSLFSSKSFTTYLKNELKEKGYSYELERHKVLTYKDLNFYEVVFKTSPLNNTLIVSKTLGYMVELDSHGECYGVI